MGWFQDVFGFSIGTAGTCWLRIVAPSRMYEYLLNNNVNVRQ